MDILSHDLRLAVRSLAKRPGLPVVAVLTLSLGIGTSPAMFTLLHGVVIRPLPYPDADRVVSVFTTDEDGGQRDNWSGADLVDFRAQATSFDAVAGPNGCLARVSRVVVKRRCSTSNATFQRNTCTIQAPVPRRLERRPGQTTPAVWRCANLRRSRRPGQGLFATVLTIAEPSLARLWGRYGTGNAWVSPTLPKLPRVLV